MRHLFLTVTCGFFGLFHFQEVSAQNYEKVWFDRSDSVYGYYAVIKPSGLRLQGALVLFGEYGSDAVAMLSETKMANVAFANDFLTVCIPTGLNYFLDDQHMRIIKKILNDVANSYDINKNKFAMGGFSIGGTIALRYTELTYEHPEEFDIKPHALFAADAPVDLFDLYNQSKKELSGHSNDWWLADNRILISGLDKALGTPAEILNYRKISPFLQSDSLAGNEKWLDSIPFRTYHDVDVEWSLKYRRRSIYDLNMLNASELIKRLNDQGNKQAEFVASKVPGRRTNGQMHPHSWNIIDETDLIYWLREKLNFYPGDISARYTYEVPGWSREIIVLPFDFAPQIRYKGYEDLRFAPGWGKAESGEKWAYTLVWWLDKAYPFDENILCKNLEDYYSGINLRKALADHDDPKAYFKAKAEVVKSAVIPGDRATFSVTVHIYDAQVTKKPGVLYGKIHLKSCSDSQKSILLMEISALSTDQPVWQELDQINSNFKCVLN